MVNFNFAELSALRVVCSEYKFYLYGWFQLAWRCENPTPHTKLSCSHQNFLKVKLLIINWRREGQRKRRRVWTDIWNSIIVNIFRQLAKCNKKGQSSPKPVEIRGRSKDWHIWTNQERYCDPNLAKMDEVICKMNVKQLWDICTGMLRVAIRAAIKFHRRKWYVKTKLKRLALHWVSRLWLFV